MSEGKISSKDPADDPVTVIASVTDENIDEDISAETSEMINRGLRGLNIRRVKLWYLLILVRAVFV